jgi:hypothetical protein
MARAKRVANGRLKQDGGKPSGTGTTGVPF